MTILVKPHLPLVADALHTGTGRFGLRLDVVYFVATLCLREVEGIGAVGHQLLVGDWVAVLVCQGFVECEVVANAFNLVRPEDARLNVAHGVIVCDKFVTRVKRMMVPFLMAGKLRKHIEGFVEQRVGWQFLEVAGIAYYCRVPVHHCFIPVLQHVMTLQYGLAFLA